MHQVQSTEGTLGYTHGGLAIRGGSSGVSPEKHGADFKNVVGIRQVEQIFDLEDCRARGSLHNFAEPHAQKPATNWETRRNVLERAGFQPSTLETVRVRRLKTVVRSLLMVRREAAIRKPIAGQIWTADDTGVFNDRERAA